MKLNIKLKFQERFDASKMAIELYFEYLNEEIEIRIESIRNLLNELEEKLACDLEIKKITLIQ